MPHRIAQEYNNMKLLFSRSALSDDVTRKFISINELCKLKLLECMFFPLLADQRQSEKLYGF